MANVAKIEGVEQVLSALDNKLKAMISGSSGTKGPTVTVGYTQNYALPVHENLQAYHPVGQAKYLEEPARLHKKKIATIVREALKKKVSLAKALLLAGLFLQRESQLLVPVDTGALKGSAFTKVE